tara:strand:+ start:5078 stop:5617 length:540 start_codon:yes stop_codon:yes gene_type:complete
MQKYSEFIEALISGGAPIGPTNINMSSMGPGLNLNDYVGINSINFKPEIINEEADTFEEFITKQQQQKAGILNLAKDYAFSEQYRNPRAFLATLLGGPLAGAASYFSGGIMDAFKNFNDRRKGRLDITADSAIMPTRIEIGAAQGSDAGFDNSDSGGYSGSANDGTSNAGTGSSDDGFI